MTQKTKIPPLVVLVLAGTIFSIFLLTREKTSPSPAVKSNVSPLPGAAAALPSPTPPSPKPAADLYRFSPESSAAKLSQTELKSLIQDNPIAAAYAQDVTGDLNFGYIAIRIAKRWEVDDPQGAVAWAQGLPAGDAQNAAVKVIFVLYGTKDFAAALTLAQSLPPEGSNARALAFESLGNVVELATMTNPAKAATMRAALEGK